MNRLIFLVALLFSTATLAAPAALSISSPINYQTLFNSQGNIKVKFRMNATTLHKLPAKVQLYINSQPVSEIRYGQATSFDVKGLKDGTYSLIVTATGHDGKMLTISDPVKFTFKQQGFSVSN